MSGKPTLDEGIILACFARLIVSSRTFQTQIVVPAEVNLPSAAYSTIGEVTLTRDPCVSHSLCLETVFITLSLLAFLASYLCSRSISSLHLLRTLCQAGISIITQNSLEVQVRCWRADTLTHVPSRDTCADAM